MQTHIRFAIDCERIFYCSQSKEFSVDHVYHIDDDNVTLESMFSINMDTLDSNVTKNFVETKWIYKGISKYFGLIV